MISGAHPQNSLTPAQMQAQQAAQAQANDRARTRSRRPTDKNIPEGVEECVIGDGVQRYRDLRELERRLDSTMMRKRLDIQDSVNRNVKVHRHQRYLQLHTDPFIALSNPTNLGQQYRGGPTLASRHPRCGRVRLQHQHGLFLPSKG